MNFFYNLMKHGSTALPAFRGVYDWLMSQADVEDFDFEKRPNTELYEEMRQHSMPLWAKWLSTTVDTDDEYFKITATDNGNKIGKEYDLSYARLYNYYKTWAEEHGFKFLNENADDLKTYIKRLVKTHKASVQKVGGSRAFRIKSQELHDGLVKEGRFCPID